MQNDLSSCILKWSHCFVHASWLQKPKAPSLPCFWRTSVRRETAANPHVVTWHWRYRNPNRPPLFVRIHSFIQASRTNLLFVMTSFPLFSTFTLSKHQSFILLLYIEHIWHLMWDLIKWRKVADTCEMLADSVLQHNWLTR
jgi:hypothetical protein